MTIKDIIFKIKKDENKSFESLAKLFAGKSGKDIRTLICQNKDMKYSTSYKILDALGYEIVIRKKKSGAKREDELVVSYGETSSQNIEENKKDTPITKIDNPLYVDENGHRRIKLTPALTKDGDIDLDSILNDNNEEE